MHTHTHTIADGSLVDKYTPHLLYGVFSYLPRVVTPSLNCCALFSPYCQHTHKKHSVVLSIVYVGGNDTYVPGCSKHACHVQLCIRVYMNGQKYHVNNKTWGLLIPKTARILPDFKSTK